MVKTGQTMSIADFAEESGGVLLLAVTAMFGLMFLLIQRRPKNFPPGPPGFPIVGYAPFLGKNMAETLHKMKSKYGPVMSVQIGRDDWVILNDFKHVNQALVNQGDRFSGRPLLFVFDIITRGKSMILSDYGPKWKKLRKFGLVNLRGFGVGKKGMERNVEEETGLLVEYLTQENGKRMQTKLASAVSNIICRIVFGSRFSYDDDRFLELVRLSQELFAGKDVKYFGVIALIPAVRHFPPFSGAVKRIINNQNILFGILEDIVQEHRETFDENNVRDIIDVFLKEMKESKEANPVFSKERLLEFIHDLFEAGTETTSSMLTWTMLALVQYPECQDKIWKEVREIIGEGGIPSMQHRDDMPYTCAFIQELMRYKPLVPLSVFHKSNATATLGGYTIPKNTTVAPNLWAVHYDPNIFESPNEFRPERFISKTGEFIRSSHVIPFSVGPRHCLGKQLARMEIFIFLTGIVQKLVVLPDPVQSPPPFEISEIWNGALLSTPKFEVVFQRR